METMLNSGKIDDATALTDKLLKENPGRRHGPDYACPPLGHER